MKKLILVCALILSGCGTNHALPSVSGDLQPINSSEAVNNG